MMTDRFEPATFLADPASQGQLLGRAVAAGRRDLDRIGLDRPRRRARVRRGGRLPRAEDRPAHHGSRGPRHVEAVRDDRHRGRHRGRAGGPRHPARRRRGQAVITAQDSRAGALRELARLAAHLELHDLEILRLLAGRLAADRGRYGAPRASAAGAGLGGEAEPSSAAGVRLGAPRCASCGSELVGRRSDAVYCTGRCRAAASRARRRPVAAGRDDVRPRDGGEERAR